VARQGAMRDRTTAVRKPGVLVQDLGGEILLYNTEEKVMHILNPTARCVWDLCDGEQSVDAMAQAIRARFAVPEGHDVVGDIRRTLEIFASKGLLDQTT
jgi:Coenzyme PQQ synthesis protein D (PqqD)